MAYEYETVVEAKVASVTAAHEIAINKGTRDGVEEGDRVELFRVVKIRDPETKEELGHEEYVRLKLAISKAEERYSIARVLDRVAPSAEQSSNVFALAMSSRPLKYVSRDHEYEGQRAVMVVPGERALVQRRFVPEDEPEGDFE